ncbi:hypothetical protein HMPREF0880_04274 [Yokenella regensburgei ATCC 43003]|nr:hypothetical protein HMPREF0880_04274 [Yokenella regensburgei ATCC 43003]
MEISFHGDNRRVSKKLPHFCGILGDNNCRFLVNIYPVRSPASWFF